MKTLAIVGAGHLGQQIAHYAFSDKHYDKIVFFDDFFKLKEVNGHAVLGKIDEIFKQYKEKAFDELLIGIGYKHLDIRKKLFQQFFKKIPFGIVVHSTSWLDRTVKIENGCIVYPKCEVGPNCIIQANTVLNVGCTIAHDTIIGNHSFLAPRVAVAGFVEVGEQCVLGINSTIIDNINIMSKTQIGAGAVVIKSINERGLYVGNPAKFIRK